MKKFLYLSLVFLALCLWVSRDAFTQPKPISLHEVQSHPGDYKILRGVTSDARCNKLRAIAATLSKTGGMDQAVALLGEPDAVLVDKAFPNQTTFMYFKSTRNWNPGNHHDHLHSFEDDICLTGKWSNRVEVVRR